MGRRSDKNDIEFISCVMRVS